MNREELWEIYVQQNPSFAESGNVTMTSTGLRKFFEQTWNHGYSKGREDFSPKKDYDMPDALRDLFNK